MRLSLVIILARAGRTLSSGRNQSMNVSMMRPVFFAAALLIASRVRLLVWMNAFHFTLCCCCALGFAIFDVELLFLPSVPLQVIIQSSAARQVAARSYEQEICTSREAMPFVSISYIRVCR